MEQETQGAEPSAAETPEFDHARGALVDLSPEQRTEYRKTGEIPTPKPEAPAAPKSETQPEADAGEKPQEHKKGKLSAEERIAQLEATIGKIRKDAGIERKVEPAATPEAKPQPPQNYQDWRKTFKPSDWVSEYAKANPEATYEDAQAAMNDFQDEVRGQFRQAEERLKNSTAQMNAKLDDAKTRYGEKFDEVLVPTLSAVNQGILPAIRQLMEESDVLPHLLFVIGSGEGGAKSFLQMPPGKQARFIALNEALIHEEFESKVKPEVPAKPKTSAPKPPAEVGGRNEAPGDELESAAKANDFRRFSAESTRRAIAKMKG